MEFDPVRLEGDVPGGLETDVRGRGDPGEGEGEGGGDEGGEGGEEGT